MTSTQVALVVGQASIERISQLAHEMPVWIPESLASRDSLTAMRATAPFSVTTFRVNARERPCDTVNRILGDLDEHHCEVSQRPAYRLLHVIGADLDDALGVSLRNFGFVRFERTPEGFLAFKPA